MHLLTLVPLGSIPRELGARDSRTFTSTISARQRRSVYRFNFLSSRFKNFKDHLESFEKTVQVAAILGSANAAPFVNAAKSVDEDASDAESRGYDGLLALVPEVAASTSTVRVTRVQQGNKAIAFLVQSPEPLDRKRINLSLTCAPSEHVVYGDTHQGTTKG